MKKLRIAVFSFISVSGKIGISYSLAVGFAALEQLSHRWSAISFYVFSFAARAIFLFSRDGRKEEYREFCIVGRYRQ